MSKDFSNLLGGALANKVSEEDEIRSKIVIRENLKALIPPLSQEEIDQLERNIFNEGVREPLILWKVEHEYVLVDGHNRYSICQKFKWKFPFKVLTFNDEEEAKDWMVKNQLGRRNLSKEQQSYLRGLRYLSEKQQGKRTESTSAQNEQKSENEFASDLTSVQNEQKLEKETTAEKLAEEYNVSPNTIRRDADFAKGVDLIGKENPELKKKILQGKSEIKKKDIESLAKKPQPNTKQETKIKLSSQELAAIAIQYVKTEKKTFEEVARELSLDTEHLHPIEFFVTWNNSKSS